MIVSNFESNGNWQKQRKAKQSKLKQKNRIVAQRDKIPECQSQFCVCRYELKFAFEYIYIKTATDREEKKPRTREMNVH